MDCSYRVEVISCGKLGFVSLMYLLEVVFIGSILWIRYLCEKIDWYK